MGKRKASPKSSTNIKKKNKKQKVYHTGLEMIKKKIITYKMTPIEKVPGVNKKTFALTNPKRVKKKLTTLKKKYITNVPKCHMKEAWTALENMNDEIQSIANGIIASCEAKTCFQRSSEVLKIMNSIWEEIYRFEKKQIRYSDDIYTWLEFKLKIKIVLNGEEVLCAFGDETLRTLWNYVLDCAKESDDVSEKDIFFMNQMFLKFKCSKEQTKCEKEQEVQKSILQKSRHRPPRNFICKAEREEREKQWRFHFLNEGMI